MIYGRLTILEKSDTDPRKVRCECSCGAMRVVRLADVKGGKIRSCGCLRRELRSARSFKHGATLAPRGSAKLRAYRSWTSLRDRCLNPNNPDFADYGGRGVTIAAEWDTFEQFYADMGDCPKGYSIERHHNDEGYNKSNCSWWPRQKQPMNKRTTIRIRYQGSEWCLKRLCEYLKINYSVARTRYRYRGWSLARALNLTEENTHDLARLE